LSAPSLLAEALDSAALRTAVARFRLVSLAEGLSYVLLMFVAMPLKYAAGIPEAVRVVGSLHGALFILFVATLFLAARQARWSPARAAWFLLLSIIPLGALRIEQELRVPSPASGGAPGAG
jgi:integral membrane protein